MKQLVHLVAVFFVAGCGGDETAPNMWDFSAGCTPSCPDGGAGAGTSSGPAMLPPATAVAPPGWHRWEGLPEDCALFLPDDLGSIEPLPWETCPFMKDGCRRAGAPWAEELDWGYGGLLSVQRESGKTRYAVMRRIEGGWEGQLWYGDTVEAAWRDDAEGSNCNFGWPVMEAGAARTIVTRVHAFTTPLVLEGADLPSVIARPEPLFEFKEAPHPAESIGLVQRTANLVTVVENYGRITVHDLRDGKNHRPTFPDDVVTFGNAESYADTVFFSGFNYQLSGLWTWTPEQGPRKLLKDSTYSYDMLDTDGIDMAWIRSEGFISTQNFESYELWSAPFATNADDLAPVHIADLPLTGMVDDMVSVGEGWAAVWISETDTRVYNLVSGEVRRLPLADGVSYDMGSRGLVIVGNEVWVKSFPTGAAGNDVRWITVFELDKLPPG